MNILKSVIIIFSLSLIAIGCGNKNSCIVESSEANGSHILKKQVDDCNDKRVLKEQEFIKDSTGTLIADGFCKTYYNSGKVKSVSFFKEGKPDSLALHYYENGIIERKGYFANDTTFGPQIYFSKNGHLDSIKYYTKNGINWSTIRLDKGKNIASVDGNLLHVTLDEKNPFFDSLPVQRPLLLITEVATVPGMKTDLNMKIVQENVSLLDTTVFRFIPFYNTYVTGLKYKFDRKGRYEFQAIVTLTDSASGKRVYQDTSSTKISVW